MAALRREFFSFAACAGSILGLATWSDSGEESPIAPLDSVFAFAELSICDNYKTTLRRSVRCAGMGE